MARHKGFPLLTMLFLLTLLLCVNAQTTGKIAGNVYDSSTEEALAGANVIVEGTQMGASVGLDGSFYIINVPPGTYTISVQMVGYETMQIEQLRVSVNRTAFIDASLKPAIIEGETIVVQAEKVAMKKDQTSSIRTVSSDQINALPVESVGAVVSMQAGVVNGHFRGGRLNEVTYMIDGIQVDESFRGEGQAVTLETESVEDLEVITGTFNAEYGRAMSGIVNAVTKDGSSHFTGGFFGSLAEYFTGNDDIFIGLKDRDLARNQDYTFNLSGPIIGDKVTFFTNVRQQNNNNHLYGIHRFNMTDFSDFAPGADNQFSAYQPNNPYGYSEHTGDGAYVPMNRSRNLSALGKLSLKISDNIRSAVLYTYNDDEWHSYSHAWKYAPDGRNPSYRTSHMVSFNLNHMLSNSAFYEFRMSYLDNYNGWYRYKNPEDPRYIHDGYLTGSTFTGFNTGGQEKGHSVQTKKETNAKFDITWQANSHHSLKSGFLLTNYDLSSEYHQILNAYTLREELEDTWYYDFEQGRIIFPFYEPDIRPDSSTYTDIYNVKPYEFSAYLQDKMEYEDMVINFGVRFDYFNPNTVYPSNRRNPANQDLFPDSLNRMSTYPDADAKIQISPRFGLAYQLGKKAILRFSYGHFFQMPPMYALYENNSFLLSPTDFATTMGNSQINAQKTVQYEIGLWQQLMQGMGLEVALFYRDIYDLQSARVITTYNQTEYGLYSNKDYGNAKGLELKFDYASGSFFTNLNYTLQFTRGNADNPRETFDRAGNSVDPVNKLITMSWDQRHTLNATVGYNKIRYGATLTGYYNSGTPYTWSPLSESRLADINLTNNNDYISSRYSVDLAAFYAFEIIKNYRMRLMLNVYNLLDRLNENWVNGQTGKAYTGIITQADLDGHYSDFNNYEDRIKNPSAYAAPRMVKLGLGVEF